MSCPGAHREKRAVDESAGFLLTPYRALAAYVVLFSLFIIWASLGKEKGVMPLFLSKMVSTYSCPMARMPRVEFDGALYHLLCRGDRREAIFLDEKNREIFLATLAEICQLLVETPKGNLVRGMHWFQANYTTRYNRRHGLNGHLFAGRYKSLLINPEERGYLATVSDYIHLNPARVHLTGGKPLDN